MWKKLSNTEINDKVTTALAKNTNFRNDSILGVPASYLDKHVFQDDPSLLAQAPFLRSMLHNPNHIGCHTLDHSEHFFAGTHELERELIQICAEDIFKCESNTYDGYVASGGTEANIQAMWIYRNYFKNEFNAKNEEIAILCSTDSHYSMAKGANILNLPIFFTETNEKHQITPEFVKQTVDKARENGVNYFIVVANMMTTMFGSVDNPSVYTDYLTSIDIPFKMHIDGAYGGFYYPFSNKENTINFTNPFVSSITLDAHKMAQAPYGTGIFLARKGLMQYAQTKEASYVEGQDSTLIGSRSGANAISIWMIMSTYGPYGWMEKIFILQKRTQWLCDQLDKKKIKYYRNEYSNIVTIHGDYISSLTAAKFGLVPDNHDQPMWYKIVVMEHVEIEKINELLDEI